uniref:Uncharacterized protein n=1 Tax=Lactuca sativa TaxID=4236 RepID=A0A9R1XGN0_LACSA|nr:hypothetical protein LSAT_V11C400220900 [Lactuca sativa]
MTIKTKKVKQQTRRKNMSKGRLIGRIMMSLRLAMFNIEKANGVIHCSKLIGELPFEFVENETFIEYTNALNGKVVLLCRSTISKRVVDYYVEEKAKLYKFFSNHLSNVHLITNFWTSSC